MDGTESLSIRESEFFGDNERLVVVADSVEK